MTKEQKRNIIGVVVVCIVVIVVIVIIGKVRPSQGAGAAQPAAAEASAEAPASSPAASASQSSTTTTAAQAAAPAAATESSAQPASEAPAAAEAVTLSADVLGGHADLSFSDGKGTITFSGVDSAKISAFFAAEQEEIEGLEFTVDGSTVTVTYPGFSAEDDKVVAEWILEDAAAAK